MMNRGIGSTRSEKSRAGRKLYGRTIACLLALEDYFWSESTDVQGDMSSMALLAKPSLPCLRVNWAQVHCKSSKTCLERL